MICNKIINSELYNNDYNCRSPLSFIALSSFSNYHKKVVVDAATQYRVLRKFVSFARQARGPSAVARRQI